MSTHNRSGLRFIAAVLLSAASLAHATMYKLTDEEGRVTYTNVPPHGSPPETGRERDAAVIRNVPAAGSPPKTEAAAPSLTTPVPAAATPQTAVTGRAEQLERTYNRPIMPTAVQDPCLRSPDPNCHWRNRDRYHPYLGYAPDAIGSGAVNSELVSGAAPITLPGSAAVGATTGSGGGAVVGGSSAGAARSTPLGTPAIRIRTR